MQLFAALVFEINVIAQIIFAAAFAGRKDNLVVIEQRIIGFRVRVFVTFLQKQHAGFGARVGFKGVAVLATNGASATNSAEHRVLDANETVAVAETITATVSPGTTALS